MKRFFKNIPEEYIVIVIWCIGIASALLILLFNLPNQNLLSVGESLIPNFIAELIFIPITVFLVTMLVNRGTKKIEKRDSFGVLGMSHYNCAHNIASEYIHLITKRSVAYSTEELMDGKNNKLKTLLEDIWTHTDKYIDTDFLNKNYELKVIDTTKLFNIEDVEDLISTELLNVFDANERFKIAVKKELKELKQDYIHFMPLELKIKCIELEQSLNNFVLISPSSPNFNIFGSVGAAAINDVDLLISEHKLIVESIYNFFTYFDEYLTN